MRSGSANRCATDPTELIQSTRLESGALSLKAWSARSTTRSMFYLVLPAPTLTADTRVNTHRRLVAPVREARDGEGNREDRTALRHGRRPPVTARRVRG